MCISLYNTYIYIYYYILDKHVQALTELNLIRAANIKVFPIGLTSAATSSVVSSLVQPPPPILNWNYFLNPSNTINQNLASPVSNQVSEGYSVVVPLGRHSNVSTPDGCARLNTSYIIRFCYSVVLLLYFVQLQTTL